MHNLALALHGQGFRVTGSDDEIGEPSRSRLKAAGLLPAREGWFPERLADAQAVILGMHARADNPELAAARDAGIRIYSYPEYVYERSRDKTRVVIGGSHGKTTITAMVLHALRVRGTDFDYLVGSRLEGFDTMVRLTGAPVIVLEGDEYLSSPIDRRPKFHLYRPHVALLSGVAWDHINVFPTFDDYVLQFERFIGLIEEGGTLIWCEADDTVRRLAEGAPLALKKHSYRLPEHVIEGGVTVLLHGDGRRTPLRVFGDHNLLNLEGAHAVCRTLGMESADFYHAMETFDGAARRLEKVADSPHLAVFRDFAHSPSKLQATLTAVRKQYAGRRLTACIELHTFSSLNPAFLDQYRGTMTGADSAVVYYNPETAGRKKLEAVPAERLRTAFGRDDLLVFSEPDSLRAFLEGATGKNDVLLMMSSGTFDGIDLEALAGALTA